jgi:CARDB/Cohesin domain
LRKIHATLCVLLFLSVLVLTIYRTDAATTTVAISPTSTVANLGDTFSVNVTVTDIVNFTSWELKIYWLKAVLNCTNAVEGPFLKTGGSTFFNKTIYDNYNSTHGYILAYSTLLGMTAVNGGGVIVTVTFKAVGGGITPLTLKDTKLGDEKIPPQPIPHVDVDGTVTVTGGAHDITVLSVTTSKDGCKPMMTVPDNMFVKVNVTIANIGSSIESFDIIFYANTTAVDTTSVSNLAVGAQTTVSFRWNITGWTHGNYTISGYAVPVSGETSIADNTLVSGIIRVVIPGNINGDGIVDIFDAILLANAFGSSPGNPKWSPNADLMTNDMIDIFDAIILANHFGQND